MSSCVTFGSSAPAGIADALRKVDCLAADATSVSFGRLFGEHGALQGALTILLTLYIAWFAFGLLTGRSTLRLSALTPRMMSLGLILTFVTSWIAYQTVVWNLAVGAPDEIAGVLVGTKGSATMIFAERLDQFFFAITDAAAAVPANGAAPPAFASPANVLSLAALILLLGTVGVLVVCRLALAALLILGPIFIVMALFSGTRGLFEGWVKAVTMFALVPLLTVIIGSGALVAIAPMVAGLNGGTETSLHSAVSILTASIIYLGLMFVVCKMAGTLTRGWSLSKLTGEGKPSDTSAGPTPALSTGSSSSESPAAEQGQQRIRAAIANLASSAPAERVAEFTSQRTQVVTRAAEPVWTQSMAFAETSRRLPQLNTSGVATKRLGAILK